jgi:hypothetical protein
MPPPFSYKDIMKELKKPPPKPEVPNPHLVKIVKEKIPKI